MLHASRDGLCDHQTLASSEPARNTPACSGQGGGRLAIDVVDLMVTPVAILVASAMAVAVAVADRVNLIAADLVAIGHRDR